MSFILLLLPMLLVLGTVFRLDNNLANGVVTAKHFWFYGLIGVSSISVLIYCVFNRPFNFIFGLVDLVFLTLCLVALLPSLFIYEVSTVCVIQIILLFVLYLYFKIAISASRINLYFLLLALLVTAFIEGVWGLRQLYGFLPSQHSMFRMTGSFFNPGPYAGYLAVVMPIAVFYAFSDYKVWKKRFNFKFILFYVRSVVSMLTLLVILFALPPTMSRAAWLAVLVSCCLCVGFFLTKKNSVVVLFKIHRRSFLRFMPIALIVLVLGFYGVYHLKKDSADGRALIWKNSINIIKENPLGVGVGNFAGVYGREQIKFFDTGNPSEHDKLIAGNPDYAFNEFLQIAVEFGLPGLLLFLSLVVVSLYKAITNRLYAPVVSVVSLLIFASMSYPFRVLPFMIVFVFLIAACNPVINSKPKRQSSVLLAVPLFLMMSVFAVLRTQHETYHAYKDWNRARYLYTLGMFIEAKPVYLQFYPQLNDNIEFLFEYGRILSKTGEYAASNEILFSALKRSNDPMFYNIIGQNFQQLEEYELAQENYNRAALMVPHKLYPHYLLAKLYIQIMDIHKAEQAVKTLFERNPKVNSPAVDEMRNEIYLIIQESGLDFNLEFNQN